MAERAVKDLTTSGAPRVDACGRLMFAPRSHTRWQILRAGTLRDAIEELEPSSGKHGARLCASAFACSPLGKDEHEGAHWRLVVFGEDRVGASSDDVWRAAALEVVDQFGEQPLEAELVRGVVGAARVESLLDELASRMRRHTRAKRSPSALRAIRGSEDLEPRTP
jgi:hypothetical protein